MARAGSVMNTNKYKRLQRKAAGASGKRRTQYTRALRDMKYTGGSRKYRKMKSVRQYTSQVRGQRRSGRKRR